MANGNGSSRWNGNYGTEETKRRANYDAGVGQMKDIAKEIGTGPMTQMSKQQGREAESISRSVPRRKD